MPSTYTDVNGKPIDIGAAVQRYTNVDGKPIDVSAYNTKVGIQTSPEPSFIRTAGKVAPIMGSAAGNLIGGAVGGPIGGLVGSAAGSAVGSAAENASNLLQGDKLSPKDIGSNLLTDVGTNTALDGVFNGIGAAGKALRNGEPVKAQIAKLFGGKGIDSDVAGYLQQNPDFPINYAQANRSKLAELVGNIVAPLKSQKQIAEQQGYLKTGFENLIGKFSKNTDPETMATAAKGALETGKSKISEQATQQYNAANRYASLNVVRGSDGEKISGPIPLNESAQFAQKILDDIAIDKIPVKDDQKYLVNILERIASVGKPTESKLLDSSGKPMMIPGDPRIAYNTALRLKKITGSEGNFGDFLATRQEGGFRRLNELLDNDIKNGISTWKAGSEDALNAFEKGNLLTKTKHDIYGLPTNQNLAETPLSGIQQFGQINKDPVAIDKFIAGSPDKQEARKSLAAKWLSDTMENTFDKATGTFNHNAPIDSFLAKENDPITRRLFTSNERSDIQYLFKTIQAVNPNPSKVGSVALAYRGAGAGLSLASGLATFASTGDVSKSAEVGLGTLGVLMGANQFAKAILLSPSIARVSAGLMKAAPDTPAAKFASKALFIALKGEQVKLTTQNGSVVGTGYVNGDGKIIPTQFDSHDPVQ